MIKLGLSHRDRMAFEATLAQSHRMRVRVRIHDKDEKIIRTVTSRILSGAVHVDMSQSPFRTLELTLLEPRSAPNWMPDGVKDAAVFANNFISVLYGVWVEDLSGGPDWVDVPVFWGPITGLDKDGDTVTIRASGKEILAIDPHLLWKEVKIPKGTKRTVAIRKLLAEQGETRFDFGEFGAKLGKKWQLGRHAQPWRVAKSIAGGMNAQLFYDGRGRARLRRWPENRLFTFRTGANGVVLGKPQVSYDVSSARNVVEVLGPEPKGPPKRIRAVATPKPKHPLSPRQLGRNGQPRFMVHVVDSDLAKPELEWHKGYMKYPGGGPFQTWVEGHWGAPSGVKNPKRWFEWRHSVIVERQNKAEEIANRQLRNLIRATVEASFECLPVPHLEEGDVVAVYADGMHFEFVLKQFTIPLVPDEAMSVGFNKRVSWRKRLRKPKLQPYLPRRMRPHGKTYPASMSNFSKPKKPHFYQGHLL